MNSKKPIIAAGIAAILMILGLVGFSDKFGLGGKGDGDQDKPLNLTSGNGTTQTGDANKSDETTKAGAEDAGNASSQAGVKSQAGTEGGEGQDAQDAGNNNASQAANVDPGVTGTVPSFDIVRVDPDGSTVIAGRAAAGSTVELMNGSELMAKTIARGNGEWVIVLEKPLEAGVSDLSLMSRGKNGAEGIRSEGSVTVSLPKDGTGELLVLETIPGRPSKIMAKLSKPKAKAPEADAKVAPSGAGNADAKNADSDSMKDAAKQMAETAGTAKPDVVEAGKADKADQQAAKPDGEMVAKADDSKEPVTDGVSDMSKPVGDAKEQVASAGAEAAKAAQDAVKAGAEQAVDAGKKAMDETAAKAADAQEQMTSDAKPVVVGSLAIEAVEIEGDKVFIAGEAKPAGAPLRLYVDNKPVAQSKSGETGRFLFDGALDLADGDHQARVDLLDKATGKVIKRAEVKFSKRPLVDSVASAKGATGAGDAAKAAAPSGESAQADERAKADATAGSQVRRVIIRRGDNLWEIARRVYGAGYRYSTIYDQNSAQIRDPHWIYPGQVFELPKGEADWEQNFDAVASPDQTLEKGVGSGSGNPAN